MTIFLHFICIIGHCESGILFLSFLAIACLPGHLIVEEGKSRHAWTLWRLSCFPSHRQPPLLTFVSTQNHLKPGASSNSSAVTTDRVTLETDQSLALSCLTNSNLEWDVCVQSLFPSGFRSTSQSMTVTGTMCVGLSSPSLSPSITQVGVILEICPLFSKLQFSCLEKNNLLYSHHLISRATSLTNGINSTLVHSTSLQDTAQCSFKCNRECNWFFQGSSLK